MKLPILLLVLAALGHAASTQPAAKGDKSSGAKVSGTKGSGTKGSGTNESGTKGSGAKSFKHKDTNQTSKRELDEGNFGDRKGELLSNYGASESPRIEYAEDLKEVLPDQSPAHQIFGARLPQISKISDVLTGQAPFEMAVANHLYAPVSIYQAKLSSPNSFEVPAPAASQGAYPNAYQPHKVAEGDQKQQELPIKVAQQPQINFNNVPVFAVKQPRFRFDSFPRPFSPGFPRSSLPQDIFRQPQQFPRPPVPPLFPLYDELGPNRYPGHVVPSQYLQQQGVYQLLPIDPGYDYVNQDESQGQRGYLNQETREELKAEPTETPNAQNEYQPKQGYHNHPNGAISFASFSQSLPSNTQHETAPQPQPENPLQQSSIQQQIVELPSQHQPAPEQHHQNQNFVQVKQKLHYPAIFQQYLQQLQNLHPGLQPEPQFITVQQPIRNQPRTLNAIQQRLLFEGPQQVSYPQTIQFQRLPAFKPLPQSQLTSESLHQPTNAAPITHDSVSHFRPLIEPKPFGYHSLSTQNSIQIDQPLAPVSPQRYFTPLPPLKPNYSPSVKPLNSHARTSPAFLPTSLEKLPTATSTIQPVPDQLISSTTVQPDIKDKQEHKAQSIQTETQHQSQTSQPLEPEITHQSQSTLLPLSVQSTTLQPFATYEAQSEHLEHTTPQPQYRSTIHPQSVQTSPRHEVIIQQQEVQELILEPSPQPSSTPHYQPQQQQIQHHQQQEPRQVQSQQHQQILEQLHHLQYQQVLQESHQQKARELQSLQHQLAQQIQSQQYQNQYLEPLHYQFQPQQLQQQQHELDQLQSQEHQHETQELESEQAHDTQNSNLQQNQHESEQSGNNLEPQHNQHKQHLEPEQNDLQVTTIQPAEQPQTRSEGQYETGDQPQPQYKSELESTTDTSHEQLQKVLTPTEPELPTSDSVDSIHNPILSPIQPGLPQLYAQPQELLDQPEYASTLGAPLFPDVQYFGKFAESIFGGIQH